MTGGLAVRHQQQLCKLDSQAAHYKRDRMCRVGGWGAVYTHVCVFSLLKSTMLMAKDFTQDMRMDMTKKPFDTIPRGSHYY